MTLDPVRRSRRGRTAAARGASRLILPVAVMLLLLGCGASAGSGTSSAPAAGSPAGGGAASQPGGESSGAAGASSAPGGASGGDPGASAGPIGGDIGDRTKGSVQATVSGGYSASIDLPYGAALGTFGVNGPNTAYLPYTDMTQGTLFLTISDGTQLLVQYAGPDNVGMTNGATPCELRVELDASHAKGTFTCKGMMVIKGESFDSADMTGSFEAHK